MKGSDIQGMGRIAECVIVRNLPTIRKRLLELQYIPKGQEALGKIAEIKEEVKKAISNLQTIELGLEEE